MTFVKFLKQFKNENSKIGDLARDIIDFKRRCTSYSGVKKDLENNNACDGAFIALEEAYRLYREKNDEKNI